MPVSSGRDELLRGRLDAFTRTLRGVARGDVRALHRTRVASRRLRELLPVLQLDGDTTAKLSRRLRRVTERLGSVRELDVLLLLIDELHESGRFDQTLLGRLTSALGDLRRTARERLLAKLPTAELNRIAAKLEKIARALEAPGEAARSKGRAAAPRATRWAVDARIARRATALKGAIDEAGAVYLPERLHAVRIALKKLRYAIELSVELAAGTPSTELRTLKRAQDLLGRLHDLQGLIDQVRQLQASVTPHDLSVWRDADALVRALENDCRMLHARYMRNRADLVAICERVGARSAATRGVHVRQAG